jgi:hypothetical protein
MYGEDVSIFNDSMNLKDWFQQKAALDDEEKEKELFRKVWFIMYG